MNDADLESLDGELASLFRDERSRTAAPAETKPRVLARVEASVAAAGTGGGSSNGGGGPPDVGAGLSRWKAHVLPVVSAFVIGGAVGGAIVSSVQQPHIVYVERAPSRSTVAPVTAPSEPPAVAFSASAAPGDAPSSSTGSLAPTASTRDATLAAERALLDVARTALGRSDGAHALEAAERHARTFPRGQMTEEREAIAVQALVKLGRTDEANARGARFKIRYPNSVLGPVIDAALGVHPRVP